MALVRKNVMVDPEQLRQLAKIYGKSESETIRIAIDRLLHVEEVRAAAEALRRRGGLDDVFGRTQTNTKAG
ncbi:MAG: hypothetical protein HY332_12810 [Chloroflexi bacterium]|nr:hypothetical protein [Chloroflexota bacterium]